MTNQITRTALSEIPSRLEALRVATTPTNTHRRSTEEYNGNVYNPVTLLDNATNVALSEEYMVSPLHSPDELVIRQRGRRSFTTWSPDQPVSMQAYSPFQRTPTKMPLTTSMILRSSPRKRLTMGTLPSDSIPSSPTKNYFWADQPIIKKLRIESDERPIAQLNKDVPLKTVLEGFSHQQLIDLIVDGVVAGNKHLEDKLRSHLPIPDIIPMERELLHIKRNIFRSLPTSRLCKKTDSTSYGRAAVHLLEFKRILHSHTKQLYNSAHWDALLDYIIIAWPCVRETPIWDSATHNSVRKQCFKLLSCHCMAAVKYGGLRLGIDRLLFLQKNLSGWMRDYEDVNSCLSAVNKMLNNG
ncbi:uncharacterized protein LOC119672013 [Teleopsis dalmanni]|uniref:uncharacterized protein LOC119668787 n=1 Tax=Teleopsis dalmanni TaxID=139649 RepID=UPI0018CE25C7|nr:uncharacterized protein LOC119668787 [Teleopsis dalmanni]XP_037938885.1 uncharacterized protein LOC119672010 [Teleopsis dalmanni]XP_037938890.1 uncharacterized protein LOC119672013 [Teleopsis dalmanni]